MGLVPYPTVRQSCNAHLAHRDNEYLFADNAGIGARVDDPTSLSLGRDCVVGELGGSDWRMSGIGIFAVGWCTDVRVE